MTPLSTSTKLRLVGPPALFVFGACFIRPQDYFSSLPLRFPQIILIGVGCGYIGWEMGRWVVTRLQDWYPGLACTRQRLLLLLGAMTLLAGLNSLLRIGITFVLQVATDQISLYDYVQTTGIQIVYCCVYVAIYESLYLFQEWQRTNHQKEQEKEQLLKAAWQARFEHLKSQVNPHFLFNALNALSTLIDESPLQAGRFVDELAKVYRYLLQANDRQLTTLASELRFIHSYAHLLGTRHGSAIRFQIDVPDRFHGFVLPPLSLQLLVENAVKHNVVLPNRPLVIDITIAQPDAVAGESAHLLVRNNLQRKTGQVLSNGVGLTNLVAKYRMLTPAAIQVVDIEGYFIVVLPLLASPTPTD